MIYVAVGTQKFQFNRLLIQMDRLIAEGKIHSEVFAQTGHSDYRPKHYKYKDFLNKDEYEKYIKNCEILVTHSGVSTIVTALKYSKPVIVFPRLAKYGEHVDDHQVQIATSFGEKNLILVCGEKDDLGLMLEKARNYVFEKYVSQRSIAVETIRNYLKTIE